MTLLLEEDLREIIAECFDKLDITDDMALTIKYIRQGLLVNQRTHIDPIMKQHNKIPLSSRRRRLELFRTSDFRLHNSFRVAPV